MAAILDHLQSIRLELNQSQAAVVMLYAGRRLRRRSRVRNLIRRPFDLTGGGAGGNQPIISGAIIGGGEAHLNPSFEREPAVIDRRYLDLDFSGAIPAPQLRTPGLINTRGRSLERDHARGRVHFINLDQLARLSVQLNAVINDFDPLAVGEAEHVVGADV